MRKNIRSVWARANEHIRVRRGKHQPPKQRRQPPRKINIILLIVAGYVCWLVLNGVLAMLESVFALLVAVLPWLALAGGCATVLYIIFAKPGMVKKR